MYNGTLVEPRTDPRHLAPCVLKSSIYPIDHFGHAHVATKYVKLIPQSLRVSLCGSVY